MITEQDMARARKIVQEVVDSVNYDRDVAMDTIVEMCLRDPELRNLFASVGAELFNSSTAVKH
jgi:hypothetical protein